jgi:hypothetical protein
MKLLIFSVLLILFEVTAVSAQTARVDRCQIIDGSRDALFIEFVRVEASPTPDSPHGKNVVLKLKNNATCPIMLTTVDPRNFAEKLGPNPTARQRQTQKLRAEIYDGELVPGLRTYTTFNFGEALLTTETNSESDTGVELILKGGRSLLFSVPFESLKEKKLILIPFQFEWETKPAKFLSDKFKLSGETHHLVWFSYSNLPKELLRDI